MTINTSILIDIQKGTANMNSIKIHNLKELIWIYSRTLCRNFTFVTFIIRKLKLIYIESNGMWNTRFVSSVCDTFKDTYALYAS